MSNVNSNFQLTPSQIAPLVGLTTSAAFLQFAAKEGQTGNAFLPMPDQTKALGQVVLVRLSGNVTTSTTENITVIIAYTNAAASPATATIATSGAIACNTATKVFYLEAQFVMDVNSQNGTYQGFLGTTLVTKAALTNLPAVTYSATGAQPSYVATGQGFSVSITSSTTDATAEVLIDNFSVEIL